MGLQSVITPRRGLNFCTAYPDGLDVLLAQDASTNDIVELEDTFLAISENGLVVDRFNDDTPSSAWKYTLPGGSCNLRWH